MDALDCPSLQSWAKKRFPTNYTALDCNVLREIQDTL